MKLFNKIAIGLTSSLMAIGVGVGLVTSNEVMAHAADDTATYVFTSKSWASTLNGSTDEKWASGKDGGQLTTNQGIQVTKTYSGANGTSNASYTNVTNVSVRYCTNASNGVGTIAVKVGDTSGTTFNVTKPSSGGTTLKDASFDFNKASGKITITVTCTTNSIYIYGCTVTYSTGSSGDDDPVAVTGVSVSPDDFEIEVGKTQQLTATVSPEDATNKSVTWESDNEAIATVSDTGLVTGVSEGSTEIFVRTVDGNKLATAEVTVSASTTTDVTFDSKQDKGASSSASSDSISKGGVIFACDNGILGNGNEYRFYKGSTVTFTSSTYKIVGVQLNTLSGYAASNITGTGYSYDSLTGTWSGSAMSVTLTASGAQVRCSSVVVTLSQEASSDLEAVSLNKNFEIGKYGETISLTSSITPSTLTDVTYSWTSSDETVATVSNGTVTLLNKRGVATITVTATKGSTSKEATCKVVSAAHSGKTAADAFDVLDALTVASGTGSKETSEYYVTGTVKTVTAATYNNKTVMNGTLTDGTNDITLFRIYDEGGAGFADLTSKVHTSDIIVVNSKIINYNETTPEVEYGELVSVTSTIVLTSIEITGEITHSVYVGQPIDVSELKVYAHYSDGNSSDVTSLAEIICSPDTATEEGQLSVTVSASYLDVTAESRTFSVTVNTQSGTDVVDILNCAFTRESGTAYADWSGKTSNSSAVYAGQSGGENDSIQLRSKNNNSGIITTASGGYLKKVEVTWESHTVSGRTINIYGSNTAYSSPTELFDDSTAGTLLGTIVCGTSTSLVISGSYTYLGIRSADSALYLSEVKVTWLGEEPDPVAVTGVTLNKATASLEEGDSLTLTPTIAPDDADNKNVTWSSSNESVTTVENGVVTAVAEGTATITVTTADGGFTASCVVTVTKKTSSEVKVTFDPTKDKAGTDLKTLTKDGITLTTGDGTFGNGTDYRIYKNQTLTINAGDSTIAKIEFTYSSSSYTGGGWETSYTPNASSWTSPVANGAQARIKSIIVTINTSGSSGSALDDAIAWATAFNTNLTCDNGVTAPSKSVWSTEATSFGSLSDDAKAYLVNADASSDEAIKTAIAKYDYIVNKYGSTEYTDFIGRSSSSGGANSLIKQGDTSSVLVVGVLVLAFTTIGAAALFLKKKKEN